MVGVRFKDAGKIYYFDPGQLKLIVGMPALVGNRPGEYGRVVRPARTKPRWRFLKVVRSRCRRPKKVEENRKPTRHWRFAPKRCRNTSLYMNR